MADELLPRFGPEDAAKASPARWSTRRRGARRDHHAPAGAGVYLYRDLPDEVVVPFDIPVLHRDDDIVVVDKPHFLATMPRGRHVAQTALVRLRRELDLPELSPAHRLDRLTAGVLLFTIRREVRGAYQTLFARGWCTRRIWRGRRSSRTSAAARGAQPDYQAPRALPSGGGAR